MRRPADNHRLDGQGDDMNPGEGRRGGVLSRSEALRRALRWLSDEGRHDLPAVEEACRRFDLSPADEEFLLSQARLLRRGAPE